MFRHRPRIPFWIPALLLGPSTLAGQAPGYNGPDARQLRAEYRAEMIGQINEVLNEWATAWGQDDLEVLSDMYMEEAVLFPPRGRPIQGREAIAGWIASVLPDHAAADAFLQDFEASGGMAAVQTNYRIDQTDGSGAQLTGTLFTIFVQQGRSWRIRSQVFRDSETSVAGGG